MKTENKSDLERLVRAASNAGNVRIAVQSNENNDHLLTFRLAGVSRENPLSSLASLPDFKILYQRTERIHFSGSFSKFYVVQLADNVIGTAQMEAEGMRTGEKNNDAHGAVTMNILGPEHNIDEVASHLVRDNFKKLLKAALPEIRDITKDFSDYLGEEGVRGIIKNEIYVNVFDKIFDEPASSQSLN